MSLVTAGERRSGAGAGVYAATIFLSAALLFSVQPMFAKLVLPHLGGAAAVWTTAMLFFQTALLAGYAYAHLLSSQLSVHRQVAVHAVLWAAGLAFLPLALPAGWRLDPEAHPAAQTLKVLALGVGVPFVALAANAPLLQKWYARTGVPAASDPYHLYAASNAGSLLALLGYPFLAEPLIGTRQLTVAWSAGYLLLGAGLALSALLACQGGAAPPLVRAARAAERPPALKVAGWLGLAFVPSSMMLGVTTVVSTDLGAFPLVWVIPLALYLLTFVLAFSPRLRPPQPPVLVGFLVSVPAAVLLMALERLSLLEWTGFALLFSAFFFVALLCHLRLYEARPPESALTWFYFAMAVGGALGGLFNSIVAPLLFTRTVEAYLIFALAGLALPGRVRPGRDALAASGATFLVIAIPLTAASAELIRLYGTAHIGLTVLIGALALVVGRRHPLRFALIGLALMAIGGARFDARGIVQRERSFFGVYTVIDNPASGQRTLINGTTQHGLQFIEDLGTRPRILSYYHPGTPLGQIFRAGALGPAARVGVVGLGVGALACYAAPGQDWRFYEIDPLVDRLARDPALFGYMTHCAPGARTILGDARIALSSEPPQPFDVLVIDAFSSDAIPVHLLTLEALALYRARLAPGGLLALHVSNRYYDLPKILANAAAALGMPALVQYHAASDEAPLEPGESPSTVVLMAAQAETLARFAAGPAWQPLAADGGTVWTDDHANILAAL